LDVGGTNFRAMYCHLGAARGAVDASVIEGMAIPKEIYTSTATAFFDFLATVRVFDLGLAVCYLRWL
jgi:hexokinase